MSRAACDVTCGVKARASMLHTAARICPAAIQKLAAMTEAPLTDSTPRPSPNENHLLINAYTTHPESPLLSVTRRISDSGCNLVDARLSTVGRDVSVTALAVGSWDSVAKLEAMLSRLEREEGIKLVAMALARMEHPMRGALLIESECFGIGAHARQGAGFSTGMTLYSRTSAWLRQ